MTENKSHQVESTLLSASSAFRFVFVLGIVNLFADMTYEGASSINGQYLGLLGAVPLAIGVTAGVGEFLGYALRFVFGHIADRTGKYWLLTFVGYSINLLAVPALALVGSWQVAAVLVVAERVGRAIRKPTGLLYSQSLIALVVFSIVAQLASLPAFAIGQRMESARTRSEQ